MTYDLWSKLGRIWKLERERERLTDWLTDWKKGQEKIANVKELWEWSIRNNRDLSVCVHMLLHTEWWLALKKKAPSFLIIFSLDVVIMSHTALKSISEIIAFDAPFLCMYSFWSLSLFITNGWFLMPHEMPVIIRHHLWCKIGLILPVSSCVCDRFLLYKDRQN